MIKLYQIYLYDNCGWCTANPKDFEGEIQGIVEEEGWNININSTIEKISKLNIGEEFKIEALTFKCFEMSEEEYKNLPEFAGW